MISGTYSFISFFLQLLHFRYKHVSIRDHAEEIAFYRASIFEVRNVTLYANLISTVVIGLENTVLK